MKILYFYKGVPTKAELIQANKVKAELRDADKCLEGMPVEPCDKAIGQVPKAYKSKMDKPIKNIEQEKPINEAVVNSFDELD